MLGWDVALRGDLISSKWSLCGTRSATDDPSSASTSELRSGPAKSLHLADAAAPIVW